MTFLKSLWTDLIDKRLWPVALALLVALVAVPVVLGGADAEVAADPPLGVTGATGADGQVAAVALEPGFPVRRDRAGKVRDPFKQRKVAEPAVADPAAAAGAPSPAGPVTAPGAPAQTPLPSTGGGGPGAPPSAPLRPTTPLPTTPRPKPPAQDPVDSYAVSLVFGKVGTKRARRTVERRTRLPSVENAFLIYLGVLSDKKTAVFLVSPDAKASGQGTCRPRKSECETVELRPGEGEYFAVTGADGKITWYQLNVGRITKKEADASRAVAAQRVARAGSPKTVTKASEERAFGSDRYAYDDLRGLLERVKSSGGLGGHLPTVGGAPPRGGLRGLAFAESFAVPEFFPGL